MENRKQKLLADLTLAIEELERFTAGATLERFLVDRALQLIVEREFEIVGEALNRLLRLNPDVDAHVPEIHRIIGLRNILAHGYDAVDYRILWSAAIDHLAKLKKDLANLG